MAQSEGATTATTAQPDGSDTAPSLPDPIAHAAQVLIIVGIGLIVSLVVWYGQAGRLNKLITAMGQEDPEDPEDTSDQWDKLRWHGRHTLFDVWAPRILGVFLALVLLKKASESYGVDFVTIIVYLLLAALAAYIYFYPSIVAYKRGNRYRMPIAIVNLAFGWTFFGWFGVLPWAYWTENDGKPAPPSVVPTSQADVSEASGVYAAPRAEPAQGSINNRLAALEHLAKLHANGTLTNAEFDAEKKKILDT